MSPRSTEALHGNTQLLRIGSVVVDLRYSQLLREGHEIPLPRRAYDLLVLFLSRPGVLLSREDIFRIVWKDVLVEDANLTQTVWILRRALGEEGKSWIRTVSKRGYVFEGPLVEVIGAPELPIEPYAGRPLSRDVAADDPPIGSALVEMPYPVRRRLSIRRRMSWLLAAAGLMFLALVGVRWWWGGVVRGNAGRVVIVEAVGENADESLLDAVTLAHEWMAWQLGDRQLRDVVPAEKIAGDSVSRRNDHVLLLSARSDGDASRILIDAQLVGRSGGAHWQVAGPAGDLPALIEDLSRRVVEGNGDDAPAHIAFDMPVETAHRYAEAVRMRNDGRLAEALTQLEKVVREAPGFPLARLQLAERLATLGRISAAREHVAALSGWIDAQPSPARDLLVARRTAVGQDFLAAADHYAVLARHHPRQWRFRIEQARNLIAGDRADEALDVLGLEELDNEVASQQAERLLLRARAQLSLGALRLARASAERAGVLSRHDVDADIEAQAQGIVTLADVMTSGTPADTEALVAVAGRFEALGDELAALRARIAAATLGNTFSKESARTAVEALLAKARAAGNPALEILALRDQARLALRERDFAAWRKGLAEASMVAEAAGAPALARGVEADLMFDEILRGDYAAAGRRAAERHDDPPRGLDGIDFALTEALRLGREGRYTAALELLSGLARTNGKAGESSAVPAVLATRLDCRIGALRLRQGSIEEARRRFSACGDALSPRDRFSADMGLATLAMLSGDVDGARARMSAAPAQLSRAVTPTERVARLIHLVPLLLRFGETDRARRFVDDDLAYGEVGDFRLLQGLAWMRKAEIALVEGNIDDAATALVSARTLMPAADWCANADLKLVEAAVALVRGDEDAAFAILRPLLADARARGDVVVQLMAMNFAIGRLTALDSSDADYDELIAATGMRGASLGWLLPSAEN